MNRRQVDMHEDAQVIHSFIESLAGSRSPLLIGVRHHSAAMSRAVIELLDRFSPEAIVLELPSDLHEWIPFLADVETEAPVALSAVGTAGDLFFYPFADFSPELATIRWAGMHDVPVIPCDLAVSARFSDSNKWFGKREPDVTAQEFGNSSGETVGEDGCDEVHCGPFFNDPVLKAWRGTLPTAELFKLDLMAHLLKRKESSDVGQLWERLVETPSVAQDAEVVRRAGLLFGLATRTGRRGLNPYDAIREAAIRSVIRNAPKHIAAVIGAFHAPALLPSVVQSECESDDRLLGSLEIDSEKPAVSLIPYSFEQLDERSGYPAGILDPVWHQKMMESHSVEDIDRMSVALATELCRRLRAEGHVAGTPDAMEMVRMMRDLARIRDLPVAGRGELLEAMQACLVQGELYGRGRAVALAAHETLIGKQRGKVTSAAPKSGLTVHVEELLRSLGLPGPDSEGEPPRDVRLDVLRNPRDRARAVVLRMLSIAQVKYASREDTIEQGARENITERWRIQWHHATHAMITSAGRYGVTLAQTIEGIVRKNSDVALEQDVRPDAILYRMTVAAECGLHNMVSSTLKEINSEFLQMANISQLVAAATWIGRIAAGHVAGLPTKDELAYPPILRKYQLPNDTPAIEPILLTCLDRLLGIEGSNEREDVTGLVDLAHWFAGDLLMLQKGDSTEENVVSRTWLESGLLRLDHWCRNVMEHGSFRMRGAAAATLAILGKYEPEQFATLTGGWYDGATHREGRKLLRNGLAGAVQVLLPLMIDDSSWLDGLESRFLVSADDVFLAKLPTLRGAFSEFAPADRRRILDARLADYTERGTGIDQNSEMAGRLTAEAMCDSTRLLAKWRAADIAGYDALAELMPKCIQSFGLSKVQEENASGLESAHAAQAKSTVDRDKTPGGAQPGAAGGLPSGSSIMMADRWRLVLAVTDLESPKAWKAARNLDQLYGYGQGEGARDQLGPRRKIQPRGGTETPMPTTAEWADELEGLFGSDVCEEVLGEATASGHLGAASMLDPDHVEPSVELLQQVLQAASGLPESRATKLRQLAKRITEQLAEQLAIRLRPAMTGLSTPRPTRRRNRRLHLDHTIRENLSHVHRKSDGKAGIVAERLVFYSPSKREMDWHITFVVDVSQSMTASIVYSALVAAIFTELPAISVRFLAFSTKLIDLSGLVNDPLALLLQVQVGGGTHIGLGLRAARAGLTHPSRSIVVLVSDFEEGTSVGEMLAEIRAIIDSGAKCIGLAALDDSGVARYHEGFAQMVASAGMSVAAVSPEKLAQWVGDQIRGAQSTSQAVTPSGETTR